MRICRRTLVLLILVSAFSGVCRAGGLRDLDQDYWMGVYLGNMKIGYTHTVVTRSTFAGRPMYRSESLSRVELAMHGARRYMETTTVSYIDDRFRPVIETQRTVDNDAGRETARSVEVGYGSQVVECEVRASGKVSTKRISIPTNADLSRTWKHALGFSRYSAGSMVTQVSFSLDTLAFSKSTVNALRRERIECSGKTYDTTLIDDRGPGEKSGLQSWVTDTGLIVKMVDPEMNATFLLESREQAMGGRKDLENPGEQLWRTDHLIRDSDRVCELRLRLVGYRAKYNPVADGRQSVVVPPGKGYVECQIVAKDASELRAIRIPVTDRRYHTWTGPCDIPVPDGKVRLDPADKTLRTLARRIIGGETNSYQAARLLRTWVNRNVRPDSHVPGDRAHISPLSILKNRRGDCKHYAVLYTALARSVGIPTRLSTGIVYANGVFYGHAWAESYVGEWIPMDATRRADYVGAGLIKFGDWITDKLADTLVGLLQAPPKIEVLGYRYRSDYQGTSSPPDGYTMTTCPHGFRFHTPPGYQLPSDLCSIHQTDTSDWTKVVYPNVTCYYPTRSQ